MGLITTSDPSRYIKWFFRIDRDNRKTFAFLNDDGTNKDLTGYVFTVRFKNRKDDADDESLLVLTIGDGLTVEDNEVHTDVAKAVAADFSDARYFVEWVVSQDSWERNWFTGDAIFHNGRFDGVPDEIGE